MLFRNSLAAGLILASTSVAASEVLPEMADGRVFGHFINDEGEVVIGLTHGHANFKARLVYWSGKSVKRLNLDYGDGFPILFKDIQATPGAKNEFILRGAMKVDESDHGAVVYQNYRLTGKGKLRRLWSIDTGRWIQDDPSLAFSPDGTVWAVMDGNVCCTTAERDDRRIHLALGSTKSMRIKRRETLTFEQAPHRDADPEFLFLSSEGPVLLLPYADNYHLLRFTDFGVDTQLIDQLRPVRAAYRSGMYPLRWQADDRVLWGNDGNEWVAWDLWDLGLSGFPDEPFLRLDRSSGEPHPARGFVRKTVTGRGYRIEHLWRSPRIEHLNERHVSEWRPGKPVSVSVSPNGRHAVALEEVRETKDGESEVRRVLRRFDLNRQLPPPPQPASREETH